MFFAQKSAEILGKKVDIIATEVPSHSLPYTEHRRLELGAGGDQHEAVDSTHFHVPNGSRSTFMEIPSLVSGDFWSLG